MRLHILKPILAIGLLLHACSAIAQEAQTVKPIPVFTADSLASGNYKDVLTNFFQLAFENLTGPQKELRFTSNPYALMLRANPKLAVDTSYLRYTSLRRLNFGVGLRLDSNFRFNGFTSGVNYAIVDKRDYSVYKEYLDIVDQKNRQNHTMTVMVGRRVGALIATDSALANALRTQYRKLNDPLAGFTVKQLDNNVRDELIAIARKNELKDIQDLLSSAKDESFAQHTHAAHDAAREIFKNRLLWTAGITDTTYNDQFFFSNIVVHTRLLKGFGDTKKPAGFELDLKAFYNLRDDSLRMGRDLRRSMVNFEGGVNYVRRSRRTDLSFLEIAASASYNRIFGGRYHDEREQIFTLNATLRLRVFDDIWIPIQLKYDPKIGNVFGFLTVKSNFTALKKLLASQIPGT